MLTSSSRAPKAVLISAFLLYPSLGFAFLLTRDYATFLSVLACISNMVNGETESTYLWEHAPFLICEVSVLTSYHVALLCWLSVLCRNPLALSSNPSTALWLQRPLCILCLAFYFSSDHLCWVKYWKFNQAKLSDRLYLVKHDPGFTLNMWYFYTYLCLLYPTVYCTGA